MTIHPDTHTIYIAGPMRGYPRFNFAAFARTRGALRAAGYAVICPAELDIEAGFDPAIDEWTPALGREVARRDLKALTLVDGIAVLRGFTKSAGARVELTAARWMDLPVVSAADIDVDLTDDVDAWLADHQLTRRLSRHEHPANDGGPQTVDVIEGTTEAQRGFQLATGALRLVDLDDAGNPGIDELDECAEAAEVAPVSPRRVMLDEAADLVDGDRNNQYGDPRQDFRRTAELWTTYLDGKTTLDLHDVAALMALLKISRLRWSPEKRDSWVDLAGYAACGWDCARPDEAGE